MQKMLVVDSDKCTGCRLCEIVCSVKHDGVSNPAEGRIHIIKMSADRILVPIVCAQCEEAPCIDVCPTDARFRDEEMGRVLVDYERCIGCKTCIIVCPFGAIAFGPETRRVISCDLCDGDPTCVRFCSTQALQYVDTTYVNRMRQKEVAVRLCEAKQKFAESTL